MTAEVLDTISWLLKHPRIARHKSVLCLNKENHGRANMFPTMCTDTGSGGLWPMVPDCLISTQKARSQVEQLVATSVGQCAIRASDTRSPQCKNRPRKSLHCTAQLRNRTGRPRPAKVRPNPQRPNHPTQDAKHPKPAARTKAKPDRADLAGFRAGVSAPVLCKDQQGDRGLHALFAELMASRVFFLPAEF